MSGTSLSLAMAVLVLVYHALLLATRYIQCEVVFVETVPGQGVSLMSGLSLSHCCDPLRQYSVNKAWHGQQSSQ